MINDKSPATAGDFFMAFVFVVAIVCNMKKIVLILSILLAWAVEIKPVCADETHKPLVVESSYMNYGSSEQTKKVQKEKSPKTGSEEQHSDDNKTITMSALDAVKLAGRLMDAGDYEHAKQILTMMPQTNNLPVEIERWYLLAQMAQHSGDFDTAIKIYRKILDDQPDLVKIRYELALCYMAKHQWYRADYHLRLAMAGADIPPHMKQAMMYYRWIARKNKNWNAWFNFGAAPDNNVNMASGDRICGVWYGLMDGCSDSATPEKAIGYNVTLGGNYEFKLSEHWRWKNEGNIYANIYDKHRYDDLYLSASTGPRYVWERGDVWLAGVGARRWYGRSGYNWSAGARLDTNYDFTRKLSGGLSLRVLENKYDEYDFIDGQTYSSNARVSYSLDSTKYFNLRLGVERDTARESAYADWRYSTGIGFGAVLPWGFHIYIEPSFIWTNYDAPRLVAVSENNIIGWRQITERDFLQRYSVSLSNNKFDIWGFVPTLTVSYTHRDSNIPLRDYDKTTVEFSFQQRF